MFLAFKQRVITSNAAELLARYGPRKLFHYEQRSNL
jgi:hypothetical protein